MNTKKFTDREIMEAYMKNSCNCKDTAAFLNVPKSTMWDRIRKIQNSGAAPWLSPAPIPDTLQLGKTTVQYNKDGEVVTEWRRLHPEAKFMEDLVENLGQRLHGKGRLKHRKIKKTDDPGNLFEIDIFDAHIGMYADKDETGVENYDTDKARARVVNAVEHLASKANTPEKAVLVFGGDIQHADNRSNRTEKSGNILDVDTRYGRVIDHVSTTCIDCVEIAAAIAPEVEIVVIPGNHDFHSSLWIAQVLKHMYANNPHITINTQQTFRKAITWGSNLLAWAHGDGVKPAKWAQLIAAEFAPQWGSTTFRHLKLGHVHHARTIAPVVVDEQSGILVEYLEALCPADAWHAGAGFVGTQRGASAFEYNKKYGLTTRHYHRILPQV
jgi:hypothetical protein